MNRRYTAIFVAYAVSGVLFAVAAGMIFGAAIDHGATPTTLLGILYLVGSGFMSAACYHTARTAEIVSEGKP